MTKGRKCIALFFLLLITAEQLLPLQALALTSGPASPEFSSFTPAGSTGMVDLFSGDSKYNIPLMDIDGYPINLSYNGNVSMDDEASWVGLGWNLNLGSVNRQLRGVPDDFNGDDYSFRDYSKPKVTIGGSVNVKGELVGRPGSRSKIRPGLAGSIGVFSDSYTGIGAEISANAGLGIDFPSSSANHVGMSLDLGIRSNTSEGVTVSPSLSLDYNLNQSKEKTTAMGGSIGLGYNTRQGLQDLTLSRTFSVKNDDARIKRYSNYASSSISFNTPPFSPKNLLEYKSFSGNFTPSVGTSVGIFYLGVGVTAYMYKREVYDKLKNKPAFGSMYAGSAFNKGNALEDFMKEKETTIFSELPNLPVTVHTPDLFNFSSQTGSGQFRVFQNGTGLVSHPEAHDDGRSIGLGFDLGFGAGTHVGANMYPADQIAYRGKWQTDNAYVSNGDLKPVGKTNISGAGGFFKMVGEKTEEDAALATHLKGDQPIAIGINRTSAGQMNAQRHLSNAAYSSVAVPKRSSVVGYLTAREASNMPGKTYLESYSLIGFGSGLCSAPIPASAKTPISRVDLSEKRPHHISEMSVTDPSGKKMVYGIPVYNNFQQEVTYAIGNKQPNSTTGLIDDNAISVNGGESTFSSRDRFLSYQKMPAYASSFLLTEIVSPDYSDVKGDGITSDDLGTAIKFNYTRLHAHYGWRTPVAATGNKINFHRGQPADPLDNKGSIIYGTKEVWYPHSVETKNKIVQFELEDRMDGIGVAGLSGALDPSKRLKRLKEIRIYSKNDLTKPVKRVVFEYNYELCPGVPNFLSIGEAPALKGKLTLKKVYFTYGCSTDGANFPYEFTYHGGTDYPFGYQQVDRWGVYNPKPIDQPLSNEWFPYSNQNKVEADHNAKAWLLHTIHTPTRSRIKFEYESDDYSYVQSKKATVMQGVDEMLDESGNVTNELEKMRKIKVSIADDNLSTRRSGESDKEYFLRNYMNGTDYLFSRFKVYMSDKVTGTLNYDLYDYVSCYARVINVTITNSGNQIDCIVELETFSNGGVISNPIAQAAWQKLRLEYPQYAFPGYDQRASDNGNPSSDFKKAIGAINAAFGALDELKMSFNQRAKGKGFCNSVLLNESFVKLTPGANRPIKIGGGARVKEVLISDEWNQMTSDANGSNGNTSSEFGVRYTYTKQEDGVIISSGVACNEPLLGGEESALRNPVPYIQTIKGGINSLYQLETPFGESYFPAASVGYSRVGVSQVYKKNNDILHGENGHTVAEFYTSREFPTIVEVTAPMVNNVKPNTLGNWFGSISRHSLTMSQGYVVKINDMHGKEKSEKVYGEGDALLSSSEYEYNAKPLGASAFELETLVPVIQKNGTVQNKHVGREIEVVIDMYEDYYYNTGTAFNIGFDYTPPFFGVPHGHIKHNQSSKQLRTASLTKVVASYGLVKRVIKMDRGSSVAAENLVYDGETGQTIVSKTFDEFKRPVYSVNLPAYWAYEKMGGAYKSHGVFMSDFSTNVNGEINSLEYNQFLQAGDELLGLAPSTGVHMWVVNKTSGSKKMLIDRKGRIVPGFSGYAKIIRSANRNMLGASIGGYTCMENPIVNGKLVMAEEQSLEMYRILQTKAVDYSENWDGLVSDYCPECPPGTSFTKGVGCVSLINATNCTPQEVTGALSDNYYSRDNARIYTKGSGGTLTYEEISTHDIFKNTYQNSDVGPMNRTAFGKPGLPLNTWYGFGQKLNNPTDADQIRYVGIGADNRFWIRQNGVTVYKFETPGHNYYLNWHILPITLAPGDNYFEFLCFNTDNGSKGGLGVELYGVGKSAIINATHIYDLQITFTTAGYGTNGRTFPISESATCKTCPTDYYYIDNYVAPGEARLPSSSGWASKSNFSSYRNLLVGQCAKSVLPIQNFEFNPYLKGFLGNYRPTSDYEILTKRADVYQSPGQFVDASQSGWYSSVQPLWVYSQSSQQYQLQHAELESSLSANDYRKGTSYWVKADQTTKYNLEGQAIESKDALNNFSAARFGWHGTLQELAASNTNNEDVYYDSFEDVETSKQLFLRPNLSGQNLAGGCDDIFMPNFSFRTMGHVSGATEADSHTGIKSLSVSGGMASKGFPIRSLSDPLPTPYLRNSRSEYLYNKDDKKAYSGGFSLCKEKNYIISAWVKKSSGFDVTGIQCSLKAGAQTVSLSAPTRKAVVEKWILVEFTLSSTQLDQLYATGELATISIQGVSRLDDLRVFPKDSNIKTYVYNPVSFKIMAELDENNLATFYEYNEQGILVRVKKETDRGIITLKESRTNQ